MNVSFKGEIVPSQCMHMLLHEGGLLAKFLPSLSGHCEAFPVELATCKVMLHIRLVCAGDVFVHVCSLGIASAVEALRVIELSHLKQKSHPRVSACLLELKMEK